MKKIIKITALIIASVCISVCFTSCQNVDDLRAHRMEWIDKKHNIIDFDGKIYKKLPANDYFFVETRDTELYYVSDSDVPLLLSSLCFESLRASVARDGEIICAFDSSYFALESKYDYYQDIIKNGKMDKYCVMEEKYDENGNFYTETKVLDSSICDDINRKLKKMTVEGQLPDKEFISCSLERCDATGLMKGECITLFMFENSDKLYIYDGTYYSIPNEKDSEISKLIIKKSEMYFEDARAFTEEVVR